MTFHGIKRLLALCVRLTGVWALAWPGAGGLRAHNGFDTAVGAKVFLAQMSRGETVEFPRGTWLRVREVARLKGIERIQEQAALRELKRRGFRVCALVEWPSESWSGGVRKGGGVRLPVDLSEAFERSRELGAAFAGLVDLWEIGNEPDVSFVEENAETYAAYLRTCRLGLLDGARVSGGETPRVLMAPLALPPGPYFERLWENGAAAETDGFNFHFYGYAQDFSGVWLQWRGALEEERVAGVEKRMPVYLTEYGYGLMSPAVANAAEGRVRQWRWFRDVGQQLEVVRPEAAMAFVLGPYSEERQSEFGLLMENRVFENRKRSYEPADFAPVKPQPWMEAVGDKFGKWRVSPALAWLLGNGADTAAAGERGWHVRFAEKRGAVVMDFLARDGLEQRKGFLGYFARGFSFEPKATGWGDLVLYNFGRDDVTGTLELAGEAWRLADGSATMEVRLGAGERRSVRVRVVVDAKEFQRRRASAVFSIDGKEGGRCVTDFWPDPAPMKTVTVADFSHAADAAKATAERLVGRVLAAGEPALRREGRWLLSRGTTVKEEGDTWRFRVTAMPAEPSRPAMAELPLPAGFVFPEGALLEFSHRLARGMDRQAWLDVYFRTENGNLYQVWPRVRTERGWQSYAEAAENFTMAFYGRAERPWRFREGRPVALVFFLRPENCPATFEITGAAITRRVARE